MELKNIGIKMATVTIEGTGGLILNKMNRVNERKLIEQRKDKAKSLEKANEWEEIITAMHWYKGLDDIEMSKKGLEKALADGNRPCLTTFGLKKSFGDAVVRNEVDKYKTKFEASVNIISPNGLVPIEYAGYDIDEKLMSPKKGSPVLVHLNRFTGWKAEITIEYVENAYSLEQIVNIINLAGFGIGIGSGRTSGYGRYKVTNVTEYQY